MAYMIEELEQYKKALRREGKSKNSIYNYSLDLQQFFKWLDEQTEEPIPFDQINKNIINDYLDQLTEEGQAARSRNRKLSSIRNFFNYLMEEELITRNPAARIKNAKEPKRLPKAVHSNDIDKLAAVLETPEEHAMLEIMYGSGIRREELTSIRIDNIDLEEQYMTVVGKGNKERLVPLSASAVSYIRQIMQKRRKGVPWLFPSPKTSTSHISLRYVNKLVTKWAEKAGLNPSKVTPHKFRHSFATDLVNGGVDLSVVGDFLGHVSAETTKIYAHVRKDVSLQMYKEAHPREKSL